MYLRMRREGKRGITIAAMSEPIIAFFIMVRYVFEDEKRGKKGHHNSSNE